MQTGDYESKSQLRIKPKLFGTTISNLAFAF